MQKKGSPSFDVDELSSRTTRLLQDKGKCSHQCDEFLPGEVSWLAENAAKCLSFFDKSASVTNFSATPSGAQGRV